jgi:hypothetical protein
MKKLGATWSCWVLAVMTVHGQARVSTALDSASMLIGDQRKLRVEVLVADGSTIAQSDFGRMDTTGKVELLVESDWEQADSGIFRKEILFTVFDSGSYILLPVPVVIDHLQGMADTIFSNSLVLSVHNPATDSTGLADIKPIELEPATIEDYLPVAYGVGLLAIAALVVWWLTRKKKPKVVEQAPFSKKPPHEIALEKIQVLRSSQPWLRGELKNYYSDLSFIAREYLEHRFLFPALESTTWEIKSSLQATTLDDRQRQKVADVLATADLVKFAKAQPPEHSHADWLADLEEFVIQSQPMPEIPS